MKNVPDIRFKGFDEKWKMSFVYDIAKHSSAKLSESSLDAKFYKYPVYGASGFIRKIDTYDMSKPYLAVVKDGAGVGNIYKLPAYSSVLSTLHYLTPTNVNIDILLCVLQNLNLSKRSSGSTIPHLYYKNYKDEIVFIPENTEQKLISSYIVEIKKVIIEIEKKIASLKQLKSASLISMFPQHGETVPRVRFKGFDGEWNEIKADNIFRQFVEKNRSDLPVLSATQDKGMVTRKALGYDISHDKRNEYSYKHILPGQFVIHLRSFQGGFAHSEIEGIASPAYTVFEFKDNERHNDIFWKYIFSSKSFIKRLETITYGIRDGRSISFDEFKDMKFIIPSVDEQKQIASYFRQLDIQISEQEKRLEKLKQIKAACLDKMFV